MFSYGEFKRQTETTYQFWKRANISCVHIQSFHYNKSSGYTGFARILQRKIWFQIISIVTNKQGSEDFLIEKGSNGKRRKVMSLFQVSFY